VRRLTGRNLTPPHDAPAVGTHLRTSAGAEAVVEATMYDTLVTRVLALLAIWMIALTPLFFM
jgi:hypothetical protein